jgi:hypothetical protein
MVSGRLEALRFTYNGVSPTRKLSTIPLIKCSLLMSASASRRLARAIDSRRPKDKPARLCTVWAGLRTAGWELSDILRSGQSTRCRYKTNMIGTCTHHLYVALSRRLGNRVLFCSRTNSRRYGPSAITLLATESTHIDSSRFRTVVRA